jgi:hypothetical protein
MILVLPFNYIHTILTVAYSNTNVEASLPFIAICDSLHSWLSYNQDESQRLYRERVHDGLG